jgi:hypothetical protein
MRLFELDAYLKTENPSLSERSSPLEALLKEVKPQGRFDLANWRFAL